MFRPILLLLVLLLLPLCACRSGGIEINVRYERISDLTVDRRVVFQGDGVGVVRSIEYTRKGDYLVQLRVTKSAAHALTEHARFFIVDDPQLTGEKAIEIRLENSGGRLLADGATVNGVRENNEPGSQLQKDIESGLRVFKQSIDQIGRDIQAIPESEAYRDLKRSLDALAKEMVEKEKEVRENIQRRWLPRIQRELDELRERLKQLGRDEGLAPLDEQVEQLRRI